MFRHVLAPALALPTGAGLWLPNIVFAAVAALTLRRIARDLPPFSLPAVAFGARRGAPEAARTT